MASLAIRRKVVGPRIKIKIKKPEEALSSGGIIMTTDILNEEDGEYGEVVQLGHLAYGNFSNDWCVVGDTVFFNRYSGKPFEEMQEDGTIGYFRIIKDTDIVAVIEKVKTRKTEKKTCHQENN